MSHNEPEREEALRLPLMPDIGLGPQARSFIQDWCDECVRLARQSAPQEGLSTDEKIDDILADIPHAWNTPEWAGFTAQEYADWYAGEAIKRTRTLVPAQPDAQAEIERLKHQLELAEHDSVAQSQLYAEYQQEWQHECDELRAKLEAKPDADVQDALLQLLREAKSAFGRCRLAELHGTWCRLRLNQECDCEFGEMVKRIDVALSGA